MSSNAVFGAVTTAQRTSGKPTQFVFLYDTDTDHVYVGDSITVGGKKVSFSKLAAVPDADDSALPADGAIAALTFSATPTQAEVEALRDECEGLRDALAEALTTINTLLSRQRDHELIAT